MKFGLKGIICTVFLVSTMSAPSSVFGQEPASDGGRESRDCNSAFPADSFAYGPTRSMASALCKTELEVYCKQKAIENGWPPASVDHVTVDETKQEPRGGFTAYCSGTCVCRRS